MKKILVYICFFLSAILLNGCSKPKVIYEDPIDFHFVKVNAEDSYASLAQKYNGSKSLAWRIKEFNSKPQLIPGQEIIIPLKAFKPGGLSARGYQHVSVLSYHNFSKKSSRNRLTVSAEDFREQLAYLKENNYHVITVDQLIDFLNFGQLPEKSVLLSIDDGWKASYDIAYPILKEFGYHATLFVPTKFINSGHKLAITWDQLKDLVSDNTIDIQCHTKSHRDLSALQAGESYADYLTAIDQDIMQSTQTISSKLGTAVSALAYPFGRTNSLVMAIVRKHGYKAAFTVKRRGNAFFQNSLRLNRRMIFGDFSLNRFIKNLTYFEHEAIAHLEPIDTIASFASIAKQDPKVFVQKKQWRTALLAWKLKRDKLMSKRLLDDKDKSVSETAMIELNQSVAEAQKQVEKIKAQLHKISKDYYSSALKFHDTELARKALLQTLLYDSQNAAVIDLFQTDMGKMKPLKYSVKKNDDFVTIASHLYHDPKKALLIPLFNDHIKNNADLKPGMKIDLPAIPQDLVIKPSTLDKKCGVPINKSASSLAEVYFKKASNYFNNDQISKAIQYLKISVCLKPGHHDATEMLEMLKELEK